MNTLTTVSEIFNEDCMIGMARYPDKYFDLAVVDPPYGIDIANDFGGGKRISGKGAALKSAFDKKDWDKEIPSNNYFKELFRVSKNQIIWGANYMATYLPNSMGWIVWDKDNGSTKFSDCELAFSSFDCALRKFKFTWNGMLQGDMKNKETRIHPTQKPVALYSWIYKNYLPEGGKVIDTHLGSGSNRIAADKAGNIDFYGWEIDKDYFLASDKRFQDYKKQLRMF